jgi:hypothetical protein
MIANKVASSLKEKVDEQIDIHYSQIVGGDKIK